MIHFHYSTLQSTGYLLPTRTRLLGQHRKSKMAITISIRLSNKYKYNIIIYIHCHCVIVITLGRRQPYLFSEVSLHHRCSGKRQITVAKVWTVSLYFAVRIFLVWHCVGQQVEHTRKRGRDRAPYYYWRAKMFQPWSCPPCDANASVKHDFL